MGNHTTKAQRQELVDTIRDKVRLDETGAVADFRRVRDEIADDCEVSQQCATTAIIKVARILRGQQ